MSGLIGATQIGWSQRDLEPILNRYYRLGARASEDSWWNRIYRGTKPSRKAKETIANYMSFDSLKAHGAGQVLVPQTLREGFQTVATHVSYGGIVGIDKESIDDTQYQIPQKAGEMLGRSTQVCMETIAHEPLNLAFSRNLADGVPLISNAHPSAAGNLSNLLATAADPSNTALEALVGLLNYQRDSQGNPLSYRNQRKIWLVHPDFEVVALQIVNSISTATLYSGANAVGAANANSGMLNMLDGKGSYQGGIEVVASPYLTDNDASYLIVDGGHEGEFFLREDAQVRSWMEDNPRVFMTSKVIRASCVWSDWRGIAATPGA